MSFHFKKKKKKNIIEALLLHLTCSYMEKRHFFMVDENPPLLPGLNTLIASMHNLENVTIQVIFLARGVNKNFFV